MKRAITFEAAKAAYPHRYTAETIPAHAKARQPNGLFLAPQYLTDLEWYEKTLFAGESELADKGHCYSSGQSWPFGQWLDTPPTPDNFARLKSCLGLATEKLEAYLQHGRGTNGPFQTESVEVKREPMAHHLAGLSFTATGYGSRIPTEYMVSWLGRWRRVYCRIYSNSGTLYIRVPVSVAESGRIIVDIDRG